MKRSTVFHLILLLAALSGAVLLGISTRIGPGVGGDATIYIVSARNFLAGDGLGWIDPDGTFKLLADFPPGYPLALSLFGLPGFDLVDVARWLNIALFAGITWLAGFFFYKATRSYVYAILTAGLLAASPVLIPVYSWAMSEPLFLFCLLLSLFFLWQYLSGGRKLSLVLSAAAAGYAFLTRYNGVVFLGAGLAGLLLFSQEGWWKRLRDGVIFLAIGAAPMLLWFICDYIFSGRIASRVPGTGQSLQAMLADFWGSFSFSMLHWVMPDSWANGSKFPSLVYQALPVAICALLVVWLWVVIARLNKQKDVQQRSSKLFFWLLCLFGGVYLVSIFFLRLVVYPIIAINNRMLSPFYLSVVMLGVLLCYYTAQFWLQQKWRSLALPAVLGLAVLWYGVMSSHIALQISRDGLGFMTQRWQQSEVIAAVRQLPQDTILVTNEPKAVLILTGRVPYTLKEIFFRTALNPFTRYGDGVLREDEPQELFRQSGAALVLFNSIQDQLHGLYDQQTEERISVLTEGLTMYFQGSDGAIYFYPDQP